MSISKMSWPLSNIKGRSGNVGVVVQRLLPAKGSAKEPELSPLSSLLQLDAQALAAHSQLNENKAGTLAMFHGVPCDGSLTGGKEERVSVCVINVPAEGSTLWGDEVATVESAAAETQEETDQRVRKSYAADMLVRGYAAQAAQALNEAAVREIVADGSVFPKAVAEGQHLGLYNYKNELKKGLASSKGVEWPHMDVGVWLDSGVEEKHIVGGGKPVDVVNNAHLQGWAQNYARHLMELPSNNLTPKLFAKTCEQFVGELVSALNPGAQLQVEAHPHEWIVQQNMGAFLGVAMGGITVDDHLPYLVEATYTGRPDTDALDLALVGKGVTFDTGGYSIKPSANMGLMKGDMGGAAVCTATFGAIAAAGLPLNVKLLVPLTENLVSATATKPGDVIVARNGKSIEVDNTDAEGRLILADALDYALDFSPNTIVDVATLTGAMEVALGSAVTGVFCSDDTMWSQLHHAGLVAGDEFWRMPLREEYTQMMRVSDVADLRNAGARGAGACTAAAFLQEFVNINLDGGMYNARALVENNGNSDTTSSQAEMDGGDRAVKRWAHLDIAGVMTSTGKPAHLVKGMSGRPTRSLYSFAHIMADAIEKEM